MRYLFSVLALGALQASLVSGHTQAKRQALTTSASSTSVTASRTRPPSIETTPRTTAPPSTIPQCCFLAGWAYGASGVLGNWWYTSDVVQTVATVFSTILDYGDREEVANVSTSYIPADQVFTMFREYGVKEAIFSSQKSEINNAMAKLGVLSTLINGLDYAATAVYRANDTSERTVYGVPYPTPFLVFNAVQAYWNDSAPCSSTEKDDYVSRPNGYSQIEPDRDLAGAYYTIMENGTISNIHFYVQTLPLDAGDLPRGAYPLATGAIERFLSYETSDYPWLTGCTTADTTGEPTVHIAVNQLTETSRVTVMVARTSTDQASQSTGDVVPLPVTPTPTPPPENDDGSVPVQTPAPPVENDDGPVSVQPPANTQVPNSGGPPDTESGANPPQNPTTGEQQPAGPEGTSPDNASPNNASPGGTSSEGTSPDTQQPPASSNPQTPNSNQGDQASPDDDGDDISSNPTAVVPGEPPASGTVQGGAQGQTAAPDSGDVASDGSGSSEVGVDDQTNVATGSDDEDDDAPASGGSSATGDVGDAIMSGIGQTRTGSNGAGYTGPAYTGAAASLVAEIVGVASLGLTWLVWCCM